MDGPSQQWGDGQDLEVGPAFGGLRQGIGGDDFLGAALGQALAGGVREYAVGAGDDDLLCTCFLEYAHSTGDGAAGVNHVIEKHAVLALNFTHHAVGDRLIGLGIGAGLVHESQRGIAQVVSPLFGNLHAAGIGGDDGDVIGGVLGLDVVSQDGLGVHVVHRAVEEALNLVRVQIH